MIIYISKSSITEHVRVYILLSFENRNICKLNKIRNVSIEPLPNNTGQRNECEMSQI